MSFSDKRGLWDRLVWPFNPTTRRDAGSAVVENFLLHALPNRVTLRSLAIGYSFYLGTITLTLFLLLAVTGLVLMFLYTPSVERAYGSIKDLEYAVSFGWFLRRVHRLSAHLMVAAVFLHMFRVFLTGAYKRGAVARSQRPFNWVLGVVLLVMTLLLSFTGYLLPWDQLAFWAITVGTNIAGAVPLIGEAIREFLLGGTQIGQATLIRFYVLHVGLLPMAVVAITAWHMWRIRKDGGLAVVEQVREEAAQQPPPEPVKSKTYSVLGIAQGSTVHVRDRMLLNDGNSRPATPFLTARLLATVGLTLIVTSLLALLVAAPLEEPANPLVTPNPAKAPWYFLGLQELVGYSALIGGVVVPGIVVLGLCTIPYLDREQHGIGRWFTDARGRRIGLIGALWGAAMVSLCIFVGVAFPMRELFASVESQLFFDLVNPATALLLSFVVLHVITHKLTGSSRQAAVATFCAFIVVFAVLTYTGTALRGPNWDFFFPWEAWPSHAIPY